MKSPSEKDKSSNHSIGDDSSSSSSFSASTESDNTGNHTEKSTSSAATFTEENRLVSRYRVLTLIAIVIAAIACGTATFFIVNNREKHNFTTDVSRR